jgi:hypothetical protein
MQKYEMQGYLESIGKMESLIVWAGILSANEKTIPKTIKLPIILAVFIWQN